MSLSLRDRLSNGRSTFDAYRMEESHRPLFLHGDASIVLDEIPAESVDFCTTSPPYWGQRSYSGGGIGREESHAEYLAHLLAIFGKVHRVLKRTGSFWLNGGDTYFKKNLLGLPWRLVADSPSISEF